MSEREPLRPLSVSQRRTLEEATSTYQAAVTPPVARYLLGRGLGREVAAAFRLGVVADPLPGHERYLGYLAIPYLDRWGSPLGMRFRCLENHDHRQTGHGKYMGLPGETSRVFNIGAIHRAEDEIHIAEGEIDAITLTMTGLPAIAIPGANNWQPHHRRMLAGFSQIYVWGDPDEAGAEFTACVCRALRAATGVRLRGGDVNETYLKEGPEALRNLIRQERPA